MKHQTVTENAVKYFNDLPDTALISVKTVAKLFEQHEASIWRKARLGQLPKGIKISSGATRWRVGDIRKALTSHQA